MRSYRVPLFVYAYIYVYVYIYITTYLSIYLSVYLPILYFCMYALGLFTYAGLHACLHAYIDGLMVYGWDECFHTCRYAYMYVCLCVRVYIYMYVYLHIYINMCVHVCMCAWVCMCVCLLCMHVHMYGDVCAVQPLSILSCVPNWAFWVEFQTFSPNPTIFDGKHDQACAMGIINVTYCA